MKNPASRTSIYKNFIAAILLFFFLFYFAGTHFFTHTHNIDGVIVVHSHPYSGERNNPNHSHTTSQLVHIAMLDAWLSDKPDCFIPAQIHGLKVSVRFPEEFIRGIFSPHQFPLRGPPYMIL